MLVAPNQNMGGKDLDLYVGTDSALTELSTILLQVENSQRIMQLL